MSKILARSGMSNSTAKPPVIQCRFCGEDEPQMQIEHPFKIALHWVSLACPCEAKAREDFKREQDAKLKRVRINKALKLSSAMDEIKSMTFENYKIRPGTESAHKEIRSAVDDFEARGRLGVFIFGETGNGKSHLTAAGGNELIEKGYAVIFIAEKDLLSRLQATRNFNNKESFGEIMDACMEADLLIWDDFMSSQKLSADEKDWIFQIINGRERANRPIWYTSNITTKEFTDPLTPYKLDDKGRTWWRIVGNSECKYNQASNHRQAYVTARALGISVEEYEKRVQGEAE
ncbi:ATP-binding protein [Sporosarcina sp. FSL K6-1508]|uniref:ATP-binding protein n=1 Tax=Sporosarcina sp. FSL K6-1508 TaxID=2921553 RepID=UPI0030FBD81E